MTQGSYAHILIIEDDPGIANSLRRGLEREDLQHWDRENFGDPETNKDLWYERSPFFFLDQVQAPVQLFCGEHDVHCPVSESIQAYDTLTDLGKECEYHLYLDERHFFLKIENQIKSKRQSVDFWAKHLEKTQLR